MKYPLSLGIFSLVISIASASAQNVSDISQRAYQALEKKEYETAAALYSEVIEKEPENGHAVYNRSICYLATDQTDKALADLNRAILLLPDDAGAYFNRGSVLAQKGEFARSIGDFDKAIALDSQIAGAWYMRGQVHAQTGALVEAGHDLQKFIRMEGTGPSVDQARKLLTMLGFSEPGGEVGVFTDKEGEISVRLPKSWNLKVSDDGKTLNMFVSLQKVEAESDMFTVGATIRRVRRISKSFENVQTDGAWLAGFWTGAVEGEAQTYHYYKILATRNITVGDFVGVLREVEVQQKKEFPRLKMYELIVGHDDDIVTANFEAPAPLFSGYEETFMNAVKSFTIAK